MHQVNIGKWRCKAVGNRFLLNNPEKAAVVVHSAYNDAEFAELKTNGSPLLKTAVF
ncbi:hypothetical protein L6473_07405 [Prevotella communis]|uniref:hypothetical protein n=1 Tax=Prevotella communis TaxID=2913614 RepID=UPI001EDAC6C4|nr:hypothetical protein [Prevotella communis]UKK63662.1 hypothetical protein L6473_07405 [Prevotella communis]